MQQLLSISFVVENASNILTKRLEWGRLAAYLEQSTRYIYFDVPNSKGRYKYFTPTNFSAGVKKIYEETLDAIFKLYSEVVHGITAYVQKNNPEPQDKRAKVAWRGATRAQACDAARAMLPAATTATVGIVGSGQALESLILHLAADELPEARDAGKKILTECRKVAPVFFQRADKPERGGAWVMHRIDNKKNLRTLAKKLLPVQKAMNSDEDVELIDFWPKDEFDLVADMLWAEADELPIQKIRAEVKKWPSEKQLEVFHAYIGKRLNRRHKPGRALELAHYHWQITGDYGTFRDLQRHRMVDRLEWQRLTPAYGYDVPALVIEAGYKEKFIGAFALSEKLYKLIVQQGYENEAQYATLMGHKMRYSFMLNARAAFHFHELRTTPQGHPGYRKIVQEMHAKLTAVHPNIGNAMCFVNKDEDQKLTRLAAELATQRKLEILEQQGA